MSDKKISIKFIDYSISGGYVDYTILIKDSNNDSWKIKSRYSQLRLLHKKLKLAYAQSIGVPEFPPKKFYGNTDPTFISQRQKALENYFNNLLANEMLRDSSILKAFIFDVPRVSNGSVIRKDDTGYKQKQPVDSSSNGQIKFDKDKSPPLTNTQGLHLIIESINKKLFDLSYSLNPPDEQESKIKKGQYEKLKIQINDISNSSLPAGKGDNLFVAKDETLVVQNPSLIKILFETTSSIKDNMNSITDQLKSKEIIHFLQAS